MDRDAQALKKSFLLRARQPWGLVAYMRGCCTIASIESDSAVRSERIAEVRRLARRLDEEKGTSWGPTYAALLHASADNAAGKRDSAVAWLRRGLRQAEEAELGPHAWAARYQLGKALGGDEGREHVAQAEQALREEGVRVPERMVALYLPGRWG
jgi:hypothetical protein